MKICLLDDVNIEYNTNSINSNIIRGAENVIINLSLELANLNHDVIVYNNCKENIKIKNVNWVNINNINDNPKFDLAISNNDIRLFDKVNANKKFLISHSIQSIEKFIRKGQLFSFIKHKPKLLLLSNYHKKNRNFFLRFFGSFIVDWAVDSIFLDCKLNLKINNNQAIFTSHVDRNLDLLVNIWKNKIFNSQNSKKLLITPINKDLTKYNIFNRKFSNKIDLLSDILNSRMFLIPGHKAELFCIAAEEARELCVPIVTLGIGCLKERVNHNETGFIANNINEFVDYANLLFNDNEIWLEMRKNLINLRGSKKWSATAEKLVEIYDYH